jgi:hypothetical protein
MMLAWGLAAMGVPAAADEWNDQKMRQYYEAQVVWEIDHCLQKCHLMDSRSLALRTKARKEVGKAQFLKTHKDELVEEMVKADVGLDHYKVQYFMNQRYHDHGYAHLNVNYCE